MVIDVQKRDAHQHEHAAEQRIEHIFQCGIMPFRTAAPELDQKVAGNQHEFPKHEKENQVQRDEDPHGRGFQSQQGHHVQLGLIANGVPGINDHYNGQTGGQSDEQDAEAIHSQVVADAQRRNPWDVFDELHGRGAGDKSHQDENCQRQLDKSDGQRRSADQVLVVEEPQYGGANKREKEQAGENRKRRVQLFLLYGIVTELNDIFNVDWQSYNI